MTALCFTLHKNLVQPSREGCIPEHIQVGVLRDAITHQTKKESHMKNENENDLLFIPRIFRAGTPENTAARVVHVRSTTPHTVDEVHPSTKRSRPPKLLRKRKVSCGRKGSKTKVEPSTREANDLVRQQLLSFDYSPGFVAEVPITLAKELIRQIINNEGATPEHLVTWKAKK